MSNRRIINKVYVLNSDDQITLTINASGTWIIFEIKQVDNDHVLYHYDKDTAHAMATSKDRSYVRVLLEKAFEAMKEPESSRGKAIK